MPDVTCRVILEDNWEPLLIPRKHASYINDHAIFKDKDGCWRLLGTCAKGSYAFYKERFFVEGVASDLSRGMKEIGRSFETSPHRGIKIAPHVFYDKQGQKYHLFFGPGIIYHYISGDGKSWSRVQNAIFSLWPALRDPFVIKVNNEYLLYLTDFGNKISVFRSKDLFSWRKMGSALVLGEGVPKTINSSCESPQVFAWEDKFILLTTITPANGGRRYNYTRTLTFISDEPTNFGKYSVDESNSANYLGDIETHAPEIVKDGKNLFITTCGWKDYPKPVGVEGEGVFIRKLKIESVGG